MKNHQARPTGSTSFSEVNVVTSNHLGPSKQFGHGQGRRREFGRTRGYARSRGFLHGRGHHHKWMKNEEKPKVNMMNKRGESACHRCGMKGHWSRTFRTSKHLVDLYQASLKNVETNFTEEVDPLGISHLEAHLGGEGQVDPLNLTCIKVGDYLALFI
ncbi:uncharacterized protein LOC141679612 [Apium graveolens]|uniref:uncharacterized protein LOC141679612 n=1 Tax=Apium graveolens TaxID=4045 RepID=UPI003D7ADF10